MTADEIERFRKIEAIFDAVLEYPPGAERDAFLRRQEATGADLSAEVRQLLKEHALVTAAVPAPPETLPRFGPWQAIRLLGRGGMGTVYLAERADGAFQMEVAVKVAPLALASTDIEERFRRERQFLASLDHPKVARLIDGGVGGSGLPYLVMEFVDGLAIDRYCDAQGLDARARIRLMRQVLEALIYVHGRGVIHRDLKPSNILVDAAGNARLLDFGTARLVDASGDTAITKTGVFAFTPDFASPEQAQARPLTVASDVYSAGVLLYRLLTGRHPYRFTDYSPGAVAQTISHAANGPSGLDRRLDAILSTALRKNPAERYASAVEMDADLARYLEGQPVRARRPKKLGAIALVVGAIALCAAAGVVWRFGVRPPAPSIAVLPFANLTADPANQYFSDGLTDGITDSLARLKTLRVIARSSAFQFKGKPRDIREVGRLLKVANVLEGTVGRSGDRVKIVVRLERVADGSLLWSNTYERSASDLFAIQSELAAGIAGSLKVAAGVPSNTHIPNAEAYEFFMRGRYDLQQVTPESMTQAELDFQHAIDKDPAYGAAYVGLASAKFNQSIARGSSYQTVVELKGVERLLLKALELDPKPPAPHAMLAILAMQYDRDWGRAERELRLAVAGPSSAAADRDYAFFLLFHRRFVEADRHFSRMAELDPFSTATQSNLALARNLEGRFAEAREISQKAAAENPRMLWTQQMIGLTYVEEGRPELALPIFRQLKQRFPPAQVCEAMAMAKGGRKEEALRLIRPYEEKYPNPGIAMEWLALAYAFMGDEPNTLKWLQRSADLHEFQVLSLAVDPVFAPMRDSPEFRALEKRIGLEP
jgi:TolB-like protein/tetratricopeptide (TPR) repeat protein